jgi:glucose 1-dehydrogenase
MRAVAVNAGRENTAELVEIDTPSPASGEYLVRVLEVGVDGTDREIEEGKYGDAPEGGGRLIIGHECLGVIEAGGGDGGTDALRPGALVVPTVRRACPQACPNCRAGSYDFCSTGDYRERGITGAHGYMCERFTERAEHLIRIPEDLRDVAVLLEPFSILERTYRLIYQVQERLVWEPERVIITGAGNMGVIAAFLGGLRDLDLLVYSRGEQPDTISRTLEQVGCSYVDSEKRTLQEAAATFGSPDIVIECTGFSPLAWDGMEVLAVNGAACLLSVTPGDDDAEIPSDRLNRRMVLGNRLVFGSVNAHRKDFEQGLADMRAIRSRYPGALERFITHRRPLEEYAEALHEEDPAELKTVLEVARA